MLERDGYPPGVPCWVDTAQPDPRAAARFYGDLFGWTFVERVYGEGGSGRYRVAHLDGRDVAAVDSAGPDRAPATWRTYIGVDSAAESAARVQANGGAVLVEPFDAGDAGRTAACADPAGAPFHLWQAGRHRGAAVVNAPGSWNWSDLNTHDTEGAKTFYGAVFGWEADTIDFGFGESTMWRLPGYATFLEHFDPGLRARHAEAGVPPGFSDAIGWMLPIGVGDGPPHWSVTFAIDDTDTVVARARRLGAAVVTEPYDAGPVRAAALRDPQGAVFSVSAYQPE